jgi:cell wall-associated NlpC family hydrolase
MFAAYAENAIAWALEQVGTTDYALRCLAFVEDAYERSNAIELFGGATAHESAEQYRAAQSEGPPPRGALVFYDCYGTIRSVPQNWGHVGLALGDGRVVHAFGTVRVDDYAALQNLPSAPGWSACQYVGWASVETVLAGYRPRQWS